MTQGNIEGIYNYCDRWCERCTFTSRCAAYEDNTQVPPDERDMKNKAFWDRLAENFSRAMEMLGRAAAGAGVDLEAVSAETNESEKRRDSIRTVSREHPLAQLSLQYGDVARRWLTTQPGMLQRLENLKSELTLGVETSEGARKQTHTIKDSLSVIQWYLFFIHIKLTRALMGKMNSNMWDPDDRDARDYDGSAKIALIAIERSMLAWSALFDLLPENEDDFLRILSILEKIKNMTLDEFPEAQAFVRPGFDDDTDRN